MASRPQQGPDAVPSVQGSYWKERQRQLGNTCGHRPAGFMEAWDGVGRGRQSNKD